MKKSEIYHLAQIAVVLSPCIAPENKLEVLKTLMHDEDVEKFVDERDAKKAMTESVVEE